MFSSKLSIGLIVASLLVALGAAFKYQYDASHELKQEVKEYKEDIKDLNKTIEQKKESSEIDNTVIVDNKKKTDDIKKKNEDVQRQVDKKIKEVEKRYEQIDPENKLIAQREFEISRIRINGLWETYCERHESEYCQPSVQAQR